MALTPAARPFPLNWLGNWDRFFFRKADPTPLGVIRIVTGLLVLYVHLAYCFDLQEFFGKDAWLDVATADRWRREMPIVAQPWGWDEMRPSINLPDDHAVRAQIIDFMRSLPSNPAERRERLRFLYDDVSPDQERAVRMLAFVRDLPTDFDQRERRLRE